MWVFSQFSVPIVPLTKCSYHFWGLHTQIVLDTHTIFAEKPPFVHVKGTTKKADAFGLFVYPNSEFQKGILKIPSIIPNGNTKNEYGLFRNSNLAEFPDEKNSLGYAVEEVKWNLMKQ